jgi:hypothetical protein
LTRERSGFEMSSDMAIKIRRPKSEGRKKAEGRNPK